MRSVTRQIMATFSDLTLGTVIVLVHVALADRDHEKKRMFPYVKPDHTRDRSSQISP